MMHHGMPCEDSEHLTAKVGVYYENPVDRRRVINM